MGCTTCESAARASDGRFYEHHNKHLRRRPLLLLRLLHGISPLGWKGENFNVHYAAAASDWLSLLGQSNPCIGKNLVYPNL
jgi:hypothetical protein